MNRREFLIGGAAAAAMSQMSFAAKSSKSPRIIVVGGGAAGLGISNRLANRLPKAKITVIDGKKEHWYQPGLTLVGSGVVSPDYVKSKTTDWVHKNVKLIQAYAQEINPDNQTVTVNNGKHPYDYLVVCPGVKLCWDEVDGFDVSRVGPESGVAAIYGGPEMAAKSLEAQRVFNKEGGNGVFWRPEGGMKCAGAPLKYMFLTEDQMGKNVAREVKYLAQSGSMFAVPQMHDKLLEIMDSRDIGYDYEHIIQSIDMDKRVLTFDTPTGPKSYDYDFTHFVPPQSTPDVIRNSFLTTDTDKGWVDADMKTLRSLLYSNVFTLGDCAGVPKGKTAASVKWQAPVVEDHLVAQIEGMEGTLEYNGYTSCPLITGVGKAMLIEFDYDANTVPSFPGIIDPFTELNSVWFLKKVLFKPTYYGMLEGRV